ncbi:TIGR00730 family Rossman fold protein [Nostoc sp. FACHB-152]|uniref:LOG family protein n=1 Tax=unclassified Nostoc TaxID=2593658 RepID=UPI001683F093|nr:MULTISPECIES: TIGR00730 family Rossman fold protein [unclassified Nostoc]MBD2451551.1 TIGR00730 family Rossman fold protein [Nostoc sp. FACHB-152]MBD2466398.1 TIGR00730 family Rossman fold protein [Nostoc sp. FACHB-145]
MRPEFNICVFCGSQSGTKPVYQTIASVLATKMVQRQIGLVYGGASIGLMGTIATECLQAGGYVVGVIPEILIPYEIAHPGLSLLLKTTSMHERKAVMYKLSNAFVALPGGFGTLDELFEILTWTQLEIHKKPVILLNIAGFFNPLLAYLDHIVKEGFVSDKARALIRVYDDVELMLDQLEQERALMVDGTTVLI